MKSLIPRKVGPLQAKLAEVKKQIAEIAPGGNYCSRCGATDVYWMTCMKQDEAAWLVAHGTPGAAKLAKPRLFNNSGGEHVCPIADDFGVVE